MRWTADGEGSSERKVSWLGGPSEGLGETRRVSDNTGRTAPRLLEPLSTPGLASVRLKVGHVLIDLRYSQKIGLNIFRVTGFSRKANSTAFSMWPSPF